MKLNLIQKGGDDLKIDYQCPICQESIDEIYDTRNNYMRFPYKCAHLYCRSCCSTRGPNRQSTNTCSLCGQERRVPDDLGNYSITPKKFMINLIKRIRNNNLPEGEIAIPLLYDYIELNTKKFPEPNFEDLNWDLRDILPFGKLFNKYALHKASDDDSDSYPELGFNEFLNDEYNHICIRDNKIVYDYYIEKIKKKNKYISYQLLVNKNVKNFNIPMLIINYLIGEAYPISYFNYDYDTRMIKDSIQICNEILIPINADKIEKNAFASKKNKDINKCIKNFIGNLIIPSNISNIEEGVFYYSKFDSIHFKKNSKVKIIRNKCFKDSAIKNITLPDKLEEIDNNSFEGCGNLDEINIPDSVHTLGEYIFKKCKLIKINLPINLNKFEYTTFKLCEIETIICPKLVYDRFNNFDDESEFPKELKKRLKIIDYNKSAIKIQSVFRGARSRRSTKKKLRNEEIMKQYLSNRVASRKKSENKNKELLLPLSNNNISDEKIIVKSSRKIKSKKSTRKSSRNPSKKNKKTKLLSKYSNKIVNNSPYNSPYMGNNSSQDNNPFYSNNNSSYLANNSLSLSNNLKKSKKKKSKKKMLKRKTKPKKKYNKKTVTLKKIKIFKL